jgi:hypothetical protein
MRYKNNGTKKENQKTQMTTPDQLCLCYKTCMVEVPFVINAMTYKSGTTYLFSQQNYMFIEYVSRNITKHENWYNLNEGVNSPSLVISILLNRIEKLNSI